VWRLRVVSHAGTAASVFSAFSFGFWSTPFMHARAYLRLIASGFTLIESMIGVAIMAILVAIAVPSFQGMIERSRVKALTEVIYANLQYAKGAALKGTQSGGGNVLVTFKPAATPQCFGTNRNTACDCSATLVDCKIDGVDKFVLITNETFPEVRILSVLDQDGNDSENLTFDSLRGTVTATTITVQGTRTASRQLSLIVNAMGRVRVCIPSGSDSMPGYDGC
jgi:type IV fimbrial biogenesis protein FimT